MYRQIVNSPSHEQLSTSFIIIPFYLIFAIFNDDLLKIGYF